MLKVPAHPVIEPPLREGMLSREELSLRAKDFAEGCSQSYSLSSERSLLLRFADNRRRLEEIYSELADLNYTNRALPTGGEWILDNFHIIEAESREIVRHLPKHYLKTLPRFSDGVNTNRVRTAVIAEVIIALRDSSIDLESLSTFIASFQELRTLTMGELWALPTMLRLAIVENLRRLIDRSLQAAADREMAEEIADAVLAPGEIPATDRLLMLAQRMDRWPNSKGPGAIYLLWRIRNHGRSTAVILQWLEERLKENGIDSERDLREEQSARAADQISIGNCISSLRTIAQIDWRSWFEEHSLVEKILGRDPVNQYKLCDFETRDRYRHKIEALARASKRSEYDVAKVVIEIALAKKVSLEAGIPGSIAGDTQALDMRPAHVGFFLVDSGARELKTVLALGSSVEERLNTFRQTAATPLFLALLAACTALLATVPAQILLKASFSNWVVVPAIALFILVASQLALDLIQWFLLRFIPPRHLPKLDFSEGIPAEHSCAVISHAIVKDREGIDHGVDALEVRYLGNDDPNLSFGLLIDFADAPTEQLPGDRSLVDHARARFEQLNLRHKDAPFFVMFRKRQFNPSEGSFMGWERKRGKIEEFNRFLLGSDTTSLFLVVGDSNKIRAAKYVITLDSDTTLPSGSAKELIGTIAHPLNRPVLTPAVHQSVPRIKHGYAIIQPRIATALESANRSWFSKLFAGSAGLDPYTHLVSNFYHDLFAEGSYVGKGIYDLRAFNATLGERIPENSLLSHDLFESFFARVGVATDIELFDDVPARYHTYARREHRWIRGDWQLLPWLFCRSSSSTSKQGDAKRCHSTLSLLSKWKLVDNLRRSLIAPAALILIVGSLLLGGTVGAWLLVLTLGVFLLPLVLGFADSLLSPPRNVSLAYYSRTLLRDLFLNGCQAGFILMTLPHRAYYALDAIAVTLHRIIISHKRLLNWESAYQAERRLGLSFTSFFREMRGGIYFALAVIVLSVMFHSQLLQATWGFVLLWLCAPALALLVSKEQKPRHHYLTPQERNYLLAVARDTWWYFRDHLNAEHNFLIPDNLQLEPSPRIANRTSPTNIGLSMLATISANDLGLTSLFATLDRLKGIYETLFRLERWNGHFINWYDTKSLSALRPRYISTVDSGNLLAHLIAVKNALSEYALTPLFTARHWNNLVDLARNASTSSETAAAIVTSCKESSPILQKADKVEIGELEILPTELPVSQIVTATQQLQELKVKSGPTTRLLEFMQEISPFFQLIDWLEELQQIESLIASSTVQAEVRDPLLKDIRGTLAVLRRRPPTANLLGKSIRRLRSIAERLSVEFSHFEVGCEQYQELFATLARFSSKLGHSESILLLLRDSAEELIAQTEALIKEIDLTPLYDEKRRTFFIGYHLDGAKNDAAHYDLLASEARLASFTAIATGQVDQKHWFQLGRAVTETPGGRALLSWSGTMFEYLMPLLVLKDFDSTLIAETHKSVVRAQQRYASDHGVPWGISESAYAGVDFEKTYQYRAFGIPALGYKRGLSGDLVVSPYSTLIALTVDTKAAIKNLLRLEVEGARGEYGFFEAIDYSPQRLTEGEKNHVVRSFFAHHLGMSLVAVNNLLSDGVIQSRFHADPRVKAAEPLLTEKFPFEITPVIPRRQERSVLEERDGGQLSRSIDESNVFTQQPRCWLLSNGSYSVMIDNAGSGFSTFGANTRLTRWREDPAINKLGQYIYLRDLDSNKFWSATYQPTCSTPQNHEVVFDPAQVIVRRRDHGIVSELLITVSPEDNVEIRKLTLSNLSARARTVEVTSFGEVVLASSVADEAHPAFNKIFIQSEYVAELETLIFSRRPRSDHEQPIYLSHTITMPVCFSETQYESSRREFIGRGRSLTSPAAMQQGARLNASIGPVLDPSFSLRTALELSPGQSHEVVFVTAASESKEQLLSIATRYREAGAIARAFELAESNTSIELRHQQFNVSQAMSFQRLATALLFDIPSLRGQTSAIVKNRLPQSGLWRFGISGDYPLVVLRVSEQAHCSVLQEILLAHEYLRRRGLTFEFLVINERIGGYLQEFEQELDFYLKAGNCSNWVDKRGGVFLRSISQVSSEEHNLIAAVSRVFIHADQGSLPEQMERAFPKQMALEPRVAPVETVSAKRAGPEAKIPQATHGELYNGFGGFTDDGKRYQLTVSGTDRPPLPWSNIVASPEYGFLVTESGGGFTWSENSRENRLTPWSNDPIIDPAGEVLYLRDRESGDYWSATPAPCGEFRDVGGGNQAYTVSHGFGFSEFESTNRDFQYTLTLYCASNRKVKWSRIKVKNISNRSRKLDLVYYAEVVLGVNRTAAARQIVPSYDAQAQALCFTNNYNNEFSGRFVGMGTNLELASFSTNRLEFLGRNGTLTAPLALAKSEGELKFSKEIATGKDVAGILAATLELAPGEEREAIFYLSESQTVEQFKADCVLNRSLAGARKEESSVREFWQQLVSEIAVSTPVRSFDIMMNGWLLYQTIACRLNARSAFYQSGGAIGFRDQLQDSLALLPTRPDLVRKQIMLHAEHQFPEGDVQHWWHPPTGKGVRTRISDDFLWLPYVTARYIEATGDHSILNATAYYLDSPPLEPDQMETYLIPTKSAQSGSLFEHCIKAIEYGLTTGVHGLPLMGAGDWNDGMNEVGRHGRGESVWLGWFQIEVLNKFLPLIEKKGDQERVTRYRERISDLIHALENHGWDGQWYRRAFYDDGTPLGSKDSMECKIDSLCQSWAVITAAGDHHHAKTALEYAHKHLVDRDAGTVLLLTPPFDKCPENPGYIKGYLPGTRENGGQYTHAGAWLVLATARSGDGDKALELFELMNPINRTADPSRVMRYRAEPYVLCGDVYSNPALRGHAGWSWYTGSASWMYQVGLHEILGIKFLPGALEVSPVIPKDWPGFTVKIKRDDRLVTINVKNISGGSAAEVEKRTRRVVVNGVEVASGVIGIEGIAGDVVVEVEI